MRCRAATAALIAVFLWPSVHHGLVRSFDLDPWSFFGWSMYAVPNLRLNVRAARLEAGSAPDWNAISPALYGPMRAYALKRQRWGELLPPDALAEQIFAEHPEHPGLLIRVRRWVIDRDSARLQPRDRDYRYVPNDPRAASHEPEPSLAPDATFASAAKARSGRHKRTQSVRQLGVLGQALSRQR